MTEAGPPPGGLFGAFVPFDERSAETFFGRTEETALLDQLLAGEARVVTFMGASGVGKTSLLRAGLTPALARRGVAAVTLGSYRDLDRELVRETSRLGIAPPVPGQDPADYLGGVAREAKGGLVLILDHLEEALGPRADEGSDVIALATQVVEEGGPLLRLVLSIDEAAPARRPRCRVCRRRGWPTSSSAARSSRGRRSKTVWRPRWLPISAAPAPVGPSTFRSRRAPSPICASDRCGATGGAAAPRWCRRPGSIAWRPNRAARPPGVRWSPRRPRPRSRPTIWRRVRAMVAISAPRRWRRCGRAAFWLRRRGDGKRSSSWPIRRCAIWFSNRRWPIARAPPGRAGCSCAAAPRANGCASASSTPSAATCAAR